MDSFLGLVLWLTSTNRWLVVSPTLAQQMSDTIGTLQRTQKKTAAVGQFRNAILRDDELREASATYWQREPRVMEDIEQEREVVDAKRAALSRIDFQRIRNEASTWVEEQFWPILQLQFRDGSSLGSREKID